MTLSSRTPVEEPERCAVCGAELVLEPCSPAGDAPCHRCGNLLGFRWIDERDVSVVRPFGRSLALEVVERIVALGRNRTEGRPLVIDMSQVEYLSSAVIARLVEFRKDVASRGGRLRIRNLHSDLAEVFRITRLDQAFELE
jgi:anti-anti-sigma factor